MSEVAKLLQNVTLFRNAWFGEVEPIQDTAAWQTQLAVTEFQDQYLIRPHYPARDINLCNYDRVQLIYI